MGRGGPLLKYLDAIKKMGIERGLPGSIAELYYVGALENLLRKARRYFVFILRLLSRKTLYELVHL
jgi:hypothetical protein